MGMMTTEAVQPTFDAQVAPHRRALHVHCYRMLASFSDAEDQVQETLVRAWRAWSSYDASTGELGLRRWLYRIATNACLDFLKSSTRKLTSTSRSFSEVPWLEPYADSLLEDTTTKETIALGYLALIQLLPAQQRAVLVLREVLGWSAAETATALDLTVAAVNSSLQRARETMAKHADPLAGATEPTESERAVLAAYIDAHQRGDAAASIAMMAKDIRITMPPLPHFYEGIESIAPLLERAFGVPSMGEWRLVPTWINRMPAAVCYLCKPGDTVYRAFKIDVIRVRDGLAAEITTFGVRLIEAFGIPATLGSVQ
jgi:RNA polymerase sigma-70 factor (TIGR02960 family)